MQKNTKNTTKKHNIHIRIFQQCKQTMLSAYISSIIRQFQCRGWNEFLCICWQYRWWWGSSVYNMDSNQWAVLPEL